MHDLLTAPPHFVVVHLCVTQWCVLSSLGQALLVAGVSYPLLGVDYLPSLYFICAAVWELDHCYTEDKYAASLT